MKYPTEFKAYKESGKDIHILTAYDACFAKLLADAGIDALLVGDSLANVVAGLDNTSQVTLDQIIYHSQLVKRGAPNTMVITDMPFLSYHCGPEDACKNAGKIIQQSNVQAVKCEVLPALLPTLKSIVDIGIPVMAHIGLTPQYVNQLGGFKKQGLATEISKALLELAQACEAIGCFAMVLECIDENCAKNISKTLTIPTIGIGSGKHCDGQVLVSQDLLGLSKAPKSFGIPDFKGEALVKKAVNAFKTGF